MVGNGVKVQIEGAATIDSQLGHGVKPQFHECGIALRRNAAAVFGEEGPFGDHIQTGEQSQSLVEYRTHDVAMPCAAEQLHRQQGSYGCTDGNHFRSGKVGLAEQLLQRDLSEKGKEKE